MKMKDSNLIFTKREHLEISAETNIILAIEKCPLTEDEAKDLKVLFQVGNQNVPCCVCDYKKNSICTYFDSYINGDKGIYLNCIKLKHEINKS